LTRFVRSGLIRAMLSPGQRSFLTALGYALVPESRNLAPERRETFFKLMDDMLATRPRSMVRLLGLFLVVMRWLPLFRFGGRLDRLSPEKQARALSWFEDFPVGLVRTGFWGVKTLVFMGYYGQPEIAQGLDYNPSFSGNERLHA
jgi:hypothetical protein